IRRLEGVMFDSERSSFRGLRHAPVGATALCVLLFARAACSQSTDGTIAGTAKDTTGGALPGVSITVMSLDRGIAVATAHTGSDGSYAAVGLPPGTYSVVAELSGFARQEIKPLTLRISDRLRVDLTLALESLAENVTVTAKPDVALRRDTSALAE